MSTLMQLWREVCERSPALVNPQGKHLIFSESDCALLGCEIERACMPSAPQSVVETLASPDLKTVTFDARDVLKELSKWAAGMSSWQDEPKGPYLRDIITDARTILTAPAPTPAAQSAGQEAAQALRWAAGIVQLFDDATMCDDYMIDATQVEGILHALADFTECDAAPVNGGERETYEPYSASDFTKLVAENAGLKLNVRRLEKQLLELNEELHVADLASAADAQQVGGDAWPMLSDMHLLAITLAYNEGYSKAYDGREFENPFAQTGSQAAAWELGTRDGKEARKAALTSPAKEQK